MSGDNNLGELTVSVNEEGLQETAEQTAEAQADEGGGLLGGAGAGGGGMAAGLGRALAPLAFLSILASLKPIQAALSTILGLAETLLAPFLLIGLRLLSPVLQLLVDVLPLLMTFLDDPVGSLIGLAQFIVDTLVKLPGLIWNFMQRLPGLIGEFLAELPGKIAQALQTILQSNPAQNVAGAVDDSPGFQFLSPGVGISGQVIEQLQGTAATATAPIEAPETNINFTGGLSALVERVNRDDNFSFLP
jgi:hypothetical protein